MLFPTWNFIYCFGSFVPKDLWPPMLFTSSCRAFLAYMFLALQEYMAAEKLPPPRAIVNTVKIGRAYVGLEELIACAGVS